MESQVVLHTSCINSINKLQGATILRKIQILNVLIEIDQYGFFGGDTDILSTYGPIAYTTTYQWFPNLFDPLPKSR